MKNILTFLIAIMLSVGAIAKTTSSVTSGNWNNSATWSNGVPVAGDIITISTGDVVITQVHINFVGNNTPTSLVLDGTLTFKAGKKIYLACGSYFKLNTTGTILKGCGGGNCNLISICGTTEWNAGDGTIIGTNVNDAAYYLAGIGSPLVLPCSVSTTTLYEEICGNETMFLEGGFQNTSGTYYDTIQDNVGCDSILITTLVVHPIHVVESNHVMCNGDSVLAGGLYQFTAGVYDDSLFTNQVCDSVMRTIVEVNPTYFSSSSYEICGDDSVFAAGAYQNTSGAYYDSLTSVNGCDSVIETVLTVNATPFTYVLYGALWISGFDTLYFWNVQNQAAGMTYQWNVCPSMEPVQCGNNPLYFTDTLVDMSVTITDSNGCSFTKQCLGFTDYFSNARMAPSGDEEIGDKNASLKFYPNPVQDNLIIEMLDLEETKDGQIIDMSGRVNQKFTVDQILETIDVSDLKKGSYILRIGEETGTVIKK
jgi:hypothetical protein